MRILQWVWRNRKPLNGFRKFVFAIVFAVFVSICALGYEAYKISKEAYHAQQIECLALNGFHESRSTGETGESLTNYSVMNRMRDGRWGKTPCRTVYKRYWNKKTKKWVCDYSWTCKEELRAMKPKGSSWERSKRLAHEIYAGRFTPPAGFECILYYRTVSEKGISKENLAYFATKRVVGDRDLHRWYCENPQVLAKLGRK